MYLDENASVQYKNMAITIRSAVPEDAPALLSIYQYYVEHTAISFEYTVPTPEEFQERIENTLKTHPYLVAVRNDKIVGYAYAGLFRTRRAYAHCCEVSIYVDRAERKSGIGRLLYGKLEECLIELGLKVSYACIAFPIEMDEYLDTNSRDFHAHMGYQEVGRFHSCGKKFGKYYDMIYMEKQLGETNI